MSESANDLGKGRVVITHDGEQHCTAVREPGGKRVAMDCPYTGKGEELSPTNMVEAALGGCMLISMGTLAMRSNLDISGAKIEVKVSMADRPRLRFGNIHIAVRMPAGLSERERMRLEAAAEHCPIKQSFDPDVAISTDYIYPD